MTPKLKRLIKEELTYIKEDSEDATRDVAIVEEKLDCMKKHIATIEKEIAYELKSEAKKEAAYVSPSDEANRSAEGIEVETTVSWGNTDDPLLVQIQHANDGLPLRITIDKKLCRLCYEKETEEQVTIVIERSEA